MTQLLSQTDTKSPSAKLKLDSQLLQRTIKKALEKGGEFAEIYVENRISRNILMEEGKFKGAVFNIIQGAGVRVISGEKTGYASTDDITEKNLFHAAEVAFYVARESKAQPPVDIKEGKRLSFIAVRIPLEEVAARAAHEAYSMLDPQPVKTQRAAVIFDPDVAYAILGGIISAIIGERVLQAASFLGKRLGQKIATELLTIIDDGTQAKGLSSSPFDGEGVPTEKNIIIEKGVLKSFMYNTIVAKRAGVRSRGNAQRDRYDRR